MCRGVTNVAIGSYPIGYVHLAPCTPRFILPFQLKCSRQRDTSLEQLLTCTYFSVFSFPLYTLALYSSPSSSSRGFH